MSNEVTKYEVTVLLSNEDFMNAVARGIEDKILYCPYHHHIEVSFVDSPDGDSVWNVRAEVVVDEEAA